jgi:hypothetical protein
VLCLMGQGRLEPYRVGNEFMGPKRVWLATQDTPGPAVHAPHISHMHAKCTPQAWPKFK